MRVTHALPPDDLDRLVFVALCGGTGWFGSRAFVTCPACLAHMMRTGISE